MPYLRHKAPLHYVLFHKPFGVLCQFTDREGRMTLSDFGPFPKDVYPVGRLDIDSEGLLLLTNDGRLKYLLLEPHHRHPRTYLVQVENVPGEEALGKLRRGVVVEKRRTLPAEVELLADEPGLPPRPIPIRFRKSVPTAWLRMTIYEGRNRQIRKMTATVSHPTLRLIRVQIGLLSLEGLKPGEKRELSGIEIDALRLAVIQRGYKS